MITQRRSLLGRALTTEEHRVCKGLVTRKLKKIMRFFADIQSFAAARGDMDMSILSLS
jgi:hypothetical protein